MIEDALSGGGVSIPPRFVRDNSDIRSETLPRSSGVRSTPILAGQESFACDGK